MDDPHQEMIKTIPCFDKNQLSIGTCVHVLEYDSEKEEVTEIYGIIQEVKLDQLIVFYFDADSKSIDLKKQKYIHIDSIVNRTCSIELLEPAKKKKRSDWLHKENHREGLKLSFPPLSL